MPQMLSSQTEKNVQKSCPLHKELNAAVSGYLDKIFQMYKKDVAAVSDGEEGHEEITSDYWIDTRCPAAETLIAAAELRKNIIAENGRKVNAAASGSEWIPRSRISAVSAVAKPAEPFAAAEPAGSEPGRFAVAVNFIIIVFFAFFLIAQEDRKSTRLNSSHSDRSRMPSSA